MDDCHAQPVGWITARNTLMGATVGLAAVLVYAKWREDRWKTGKWLAPLLFGGSLLCAEGGIQPQAPRDSGAATFRRPHA